MSPTEHLAEASQPNAKKIKTSHSSDNDEEGKMTVQTEDQDGSGHEAFIDETSVDEVKNNTKILPEGAVAAIGQVGKNEHGMDSTDTKQTITIE